MNEVLAKLRMKPGQRAVVLDMPESYRKVLADLPDGVELAAELDGKFDFIHAFASQKTDIQSRAPQLRDALKQNGILWVSYPKGKALQTDLNRDVLREALAKTGLEGISLVAIDDVWSAMRFKLV